MTDRVAFDFDNTITTGDCKFWNDERPEPDEAVIEAVNDYYKSGGTVLIWTARPWTEAGRIAGHLTEWGVRYHGIRCDKGSADAYVDDKALRPEEIAETEERRPDISTRLEIRDTADVPTASTSVADILAENEDDI